MKTYTLLTPDGTRLGPVLENVLRSDLRDGRYPVGTMALAEGMDDWVPLEELFPSTPCEPAEEVDMEAVSRTPWSALLYNIRHWSFEGRATRREFLMLSIAVFVLFLPIYPLLEQLIFRLMGLSFNSLLTYLALPLLPIIFLLPAAARRLHDSGHCGWWLLLIPALYPAGLILVVYLFCQDSQYGNQYGPSTKYPN